MALLIADAGPLFSLAAGDLLAVLERFSLGVTDVVKEETFDRGLLPHCSVEAQRLIAFYHRHAAHVRIIPTQVGAQLAAQREMNPRYAPPRNLGELSIQSHLIERHVTRPLEPAVVLFEDGWFVSHAAALPGSCILLSTQAFLINLERSNIIRSAAEARAAIAFGRPDASLLVHRQDIGKA